MRLRNILEMRRFNPKNEPHGPDSYVFGNELGERSNGFARAWRRAVLVSHGFKPSYRKREQGEGQKPKRTAVLSAESREALRTIDLHFHDLRREAGSRWLDRGMRLTAVRDLLGHSNISQTSTYLSTTTASLHDEMARVDALQPTATGVETGGQTRPRSDMETDRTTNKNADGRDLTIM